MSKIQLIFSPIYKLMANLQFNNKFLLIMLITVLGYIPGTYFTYTSINGSKQTAKHEIQGVSYFLVALQPYYDLLKSYNAGSLNSGVELLNEAREKIDGLNNLDKEMDNPFKNSEIINELQNLIASGSSSADIKALQNTLLKAISKYKVLIDNIVGNSELALDPDYDSYFVMDAVAVQMYQLLDENYKLAEILKSNTSLGAKADRTSEFVLRSRIVERIDAITTDLNKAESVNDDLKEYAVSTSRVLKNIQDQINPENQAINVDNFSTNQNALYTANTDGLNLLKGLLEHRLSSLQSTLWHALLITFIAFVMVSYCIIGLTHNLRESIYLLIDAIKKISSGNLSSTLPELGKDELNQIVDYMAVMQKYLSTMVHEITEVSSYVSFSSKEIASGNNDLSERTQEQASCLVETSASLNNLTNTIKKNAESAKDAAELSNSATHEAEKGGSAVNQAILTMGDINQSAQKIQEITSVIDSIAFQTNLLALNASVEAARAGEQGRGFAVVASEVRNLAQRSAEAAKQIKLLINDSMSKVAAGDAQVKLTYSTMQDIMSSIRGVNEIIAKISVASAEQSNSIEQINLVISQLEGNTQKNAAQVEEVAASAELLKDQSSKLVDLVNQFVIDKSTLNEEVDNSNDKKEVLKNSKAEVKTPQSQKPKAGQSSQAKHSSDSKEKPHTTKPKTDPNDDDSSWKQF